MHIRRKEALLQASLLKESLVILLMVLLVALNSSGVGGVNGFNCLVAGIIPFQIVGKKSGLHASPMGKISISFLRNQIDPRTFA